MQRRNGGGVRAFVACVTRCEEARIEAAHKGRGGEKFFFSEGGLGRRVRSLEGHLRGEASELG